MIERIRPEDEPSIVIELRPESKLTPLFESLERENAHVESTNCGRSNPAA